MPTYQYQCTECGEGLEAVQKFTDDALIELPADVQVPTSVRDDTRSDASIRVTSTADVSVVATVPDLAALSKEIGGKHVKISVDAVPSEAVTWGHRFHAPARIEPKDFADYAAKLRATRVEIDREARSRLKHLQEGTSAFDIEYNKTVEQIRRARGLI